MRFFERSPVRFLIAGGVNTAFGYALYLILNLTMSYTWAYSLSYLAGIAFSYVVNTIYVFKARLNWRRFLAYPIVYVLQYALGISIVRVCVEYDLAPEWLAPLVAVAIGLPATYLLGRWIIKGKLRDDRFSS